MWCIDVAAMWVDEDIAVKLRKALSILRKRLRQREGYGRVELPEPESFL
jgi:hypothetical protein